MIIHSTLTASTNNVDSCPQKTSGSDQYPSINSQLKKGRQSHLKFPTRATNKPRRDVRSHQRPRFCGGFVCWDLPYTRSERGFDKTECSVTRSHLKTGHSELVVSSFDPELTCHRSTLVSEKSTPKCATEWKANDNRNHWPCRSR